MISHEPLVAVSSLGRRSCNKSGSDSCSLKHGTTTEINGSISSVVPASGSSTAACGKCIVRGSLVNYRPKSPSLVAVKGDPRIFKRYLLADSVRHSEIASDKQMKKFAVQRWEFR